MYIFIFILFFVVGVLTPLSAIFQLYHLQGPGGSMREVVGSNSSYKHITNTAWVRAQLCKLQKGCTRLAAANDKVYQWLAQGRFKRHNEYFQLYPAENKTFS
jgi:hypothetical protein